jgi:Zn finger protein HypA/HybF involved in hydrogenase expression
MIKTVEVEALHCKCNLCGHDWYAYGGEPVYCPKCKSRRWNGEKKVGRPPSVKKEK